MDPHDPRKWHWAEGMPESLAQTKVRMAVKTLNIRHNADGTITISANNYRESIEVEGKSENELFECARYAIICAGFDFSADTERLLRSELGRLNQR